MSKKILILHPNFPGQFKNLSRVMSDKGYQVKFLCQTHYGRVVPKVERLCLKGELSNEVFEEQTKGKTTDKHAEVMATQYREGLKQLRKSGWFPDITISHSGWGCGLFVKEIFPMTNHISYLEWWFGNEKNLLSQMGTKDWFELSDRSRKKFWNRNATLSLELVNCDRIVAPSIWQYLQLPSSLRKLCCVIYDGLDINLINSIKANKSKTPLLTYGTRGMEPVRYFPEFIDMIEDLLENNLDLRIEIGGTDTVNYGGKIPKEGSWKKWSSNRLEKYINTERVIFKGYMNYEEYIGWIKSSWMHVYLTRPYVASWSLAEAAACKTPLIFNKNYPCLEICQGRNAWILETMSKDALRSAWQKAREGEKAPAVPDLDSAHAFNRLGLVHGNRFCSFASCQESAQAWIDVADGQLLTGF